MKAEIKVGDCVWLLDFGKPSDEVGVVEEVDEEDHSAIVAVTLPSGEVSRASFDLDDLQHTKEEGGR